jgi:hypothetical protein
MVARGIWPLCTFPGCGHRRTWETPQKAEQAMLRHREWVANGTAVCWCHGAEAGATFPCDETEKATHHA